MVLDHLVQVAPVEPGEVELRLYLLREHRHDGLHEYGEVLDDVDAVGEHPTPLLRVCLHQLPGLVVLEVLVPHAAYGEHLVDGVPEIEARVVGLSRQAPLPHFLQ